MKKILFITLILLFNISIGQIIGNQLNIGNTTYKWVDPFAKSDEWKAIETYANANSLDLPTNTTAYDQLIKDLKSAGIWQKLDVFYVFAGDGSNGFKLINWKNPNQHYATAYGGLTWNLDGVKGNQSNAYLNTNYNPTTDAINYVLNEAGRLAVVVEEATGTTTMRNIDGVMGGTGQNGMINTLQAAQRINMGMNTLVGGNVDFSGIGLMTINEVSETDIMLTNKDIQINRTRTLSVIYNSPQTIFRRSTSYGNPKLSCYGIGGALTYVETQTFRTIYNNFLIAIGQTPVA